MISLRLPDVDFGNQPVGAFDSAIETLAFEHAGCLRALAEFSEQTGSDTVPGENAGEKDWRAAGQKVTFRFYRALYRDLFKNEVRRLLPANFVRFDAESDDAPITPQP